MFLEIKEKVLWAAFVVSVVALVVEHQFADQASEGCDVLEVWVFTCELSYFCVSFVKLSRESSIMFLYLMHL